MIDLGLMFGGRSAEHEVSIASARSVAGALGRDNYNVTPIGVTRAGAWVVPRDLDVALRDGLDDVAAEPVALDLQPGGSPFLVGADHRPLDLDVVFSVLHGTYGEDGTIQGAFELADVAYTGSGVAASAAAMDKELMKGLFAAAGLPQVDYLVLRDADYEEGAAVPQIEERLDYPVFVKPANLGSSVGITKAHCRDELVESLRLAFRYDRKILVEAFADAREIECAVLGNDDPEVSVPGEVLPVNEFYDYESKYTDGMMAFVIPADLPQEQAGEVRRLAAAAFKAVDCAGFARCDFFAYRDGGPVLVNEVNTTPGLTDMSAFPKLWAGTGVPYPELADRIVSLALERHGAKSRLSTSR
jgi:D-alanine-D-alanine ligase